MTRAPQDNILDPSNVQEPKKKRAKKKNPKKGEKLRVWEYTKSIGKAPELTQEIGSKIALPNLTFWALVTMKQQDTKTLSYVPFGIRKT